ADDRYKTVEWNLKCAEGGSLYKQCDLGLCDRNRIGGADDKQLAAEGELKFDEEVLDNCYQSDEAIVVMETPLDEVMRIDAMMRGLLESLTKTECDSNDTDNINSEIKECERGVNEKQEDTNRKVIANKKENEGAYGVKNKNIENILIYDNETAQNVKSNLVFNKPVEHEVLGYAGEAFDTIEDFNGIDENKLNTNLEIKMPPINGAAKSLVENKDLSANQTKGDVE
ncbi:4465_t:CDS:2, partial [Racocetra persica]